MLMGNETPNLSNERECPPRRPTCEASEPIDEGQPAPVAHTETPQLEASPAFNSSAPQPSLAECNAGTQLAGEVAASERPTAGDESMANPSGLDSHHSTPSDPNVRSVTGNDTRAANGGSEPQPNTTPSQAGIQTEADWTKLTEQVWQHESERVKRWRNEINSLLTFAGLFSAVITGFAVQYYGILQPPPDPNMQILIQISRQLEVIVNHTAGGSSQAFLPAYSSGSIPPPTAAPTYVAALWFAALICGLGAASIAILVNQWLNNLLTPTALSGNGSHEQLRIWNLRHQTFRRWRLAAFIDVPSVLLQIALLLFLGGLVGYLWELSKVEITIPTTVLFLLLFLFLLATTCIPVFVPYTPFISPQSKFLCWVSLLLKLVWYGVAYHFVDWLSDKAMVRDIYIMDEDSALQLYRRINARRYILQAVRAHGGYFSWAVGESTYLTTKAGHVSDETIVANMLPVIKDDDSSASFMEAFLNVMQPQMALKNVAVMCQRRPLSLPDSEESPWQSSAEPQNKFVTAGVNFAGRFLGVGENVIANVPDKNLVALQQQAIEVYDAALTALRSNRTGRPVYLQLFNILKQGRIGEKKDLQMSILELIYQHSDTSDTEKWPEDDVWRITSWEYHKTTDPCVVMTYTAVNLMLLGKPECGSLNRWLYVKNALNKLNTHKVPAARSDAAKGSAPWGLPYWSQNALTRSMRDLARLASKQQPSGSADTEGSDTERRVAVQLLEEILIEVKTKIGAAEFDSNNRTVWSFQEAMDMVQNANSGFDPKGPTEASGSVSQGVPEGEAQGSPADSLQMSLVTFMRKLSRASPQSQGSDTDIEKDAAKASAGAPTAATPLDGITEEGTDDVARLDYQSLGTPPDA